MELLKESSATIDRADTFSAIPDRDGIDMAVIALCEPHGAPTTRHLVGLEYVPETRQWSISIFPDGAEEAIGSIDLPPRG